MTVRPKAVYINIGIDDYQRNLSGRNLNVGKFHFLGKTEQLKSRTRERKTNFLVNGYTYQC